MTNALKTGLYTIRSKINNLSVGIHPMEDRSPLPKRLYALRQAPQDRIFRVIETREGYVIEANGAATAPWRGDVFAFSRGQQTPAERWIIAARPQHEGFFTIETNDHRSGWAISDIEIDLRGSHINVKPLNSTQTSTPRFTPEELFEFIRIEKGDD